MGLGCKTIVITTIIVSVAVVSILSWVFVPVAVRIKSYCTFLTFLFVLRDIVIIIPCHRFVSGNTGVSFFQDLWGSLVPFTEINSTDGGSVGGQSANGGDRYWKFHLNLVMSRYDY